MDETLIHSFFELDFLETPFFRDLKKDPENPTFFDITYKYGRLWGLYRPHLKVFLQTIVKNFDNVVIWSAGRDHYVNAIIKHMFDEFKLPQPVLILTRGHCRWMKYKDDYKPHKPINDCKQYLFELGIYMDYEQTVIIDDKNYTFFYNPSSGILIPPFTSRWEKPSIDDINGSDDIALLKLIKWLRQVVAKKDFRKLHKPFPYFRRYYK